MSLNTKKSNKGQSREHIQGQIMLLMFQSKSNREIQWNNRDTVKGKFDLVNKKNQSHLQRYFEHIYSGEAQWNKSYHSSQYRTFIVTIVSKKKVLSMYIFRMLLTGFLIILISALVQLWSDISHTGRWCQLFWFCLFNIYKRTCLPNPPWFNITWHFLQDCMLCITL